MLSTSERVKDLIGSDLHPDNGLFRQSLQDGAVDVIRKVKITSPGEAHLFVKDIMVGSGGVNLISNDILEVVSLERNEYECRQVSPNSKRQLTDANSVYFAVSDDPVYYIHDKHIFIKPDPTTSELAKLYYVPVFELNESSSDLVDFPEKYTEHLSVFSAIVQIQRFLSEKDTELPSNLVLPVAPVLPELSTSSVTLTGTAPEYIQPLLTLPSVPVINDLVISTPPPIPPEIESSITVEYPTHPGYTAPALPSLDFTDANTWINDEEDTEMLNARISEINARISQYNADMNGADKVYQGAKDVFQKEIEELMKNNDYKTGIDDRTLTKYSNELTDYTNQVSTETQQYQQNLAKITQLWQQDSSNVLQEYQANMTNNLNAFNKENTAYQADIQKDIQNAQLSDGNEARKLQKYQQEVATYQAELQKEVQRHQTALQKINVDYQWMQNQLAYLKQYYNELFGLQMQPQGGDRDGR